MLDIYRLYLPRCCKPREGAGQPAFAGLWEEEELKLFITLKQCVHRAFCSPSAPQRPGELELLLLFKRFSSCSFSSCHLTARLWLMTGPSVPALPSLLHLILIFFFPLSLLLLIFFSLSLTQTADLNVQNKLCWIMDEGSCIIYGATGWGEAVSALPLPLVPCAILCPFAEQTKEVVAPGSVVAALYILY